MSNYKSDGFIAITSVLVIMSVVLVISVSTALFVVNEVQSSLSHKSSTDAQNVLESCVEDALLYLNLNEALPPNIIFPQGTCSVTIDAQSGGEWQFTVATSVDGYLKSLQLKASRTNKVTITEWELL